MKQLRPDRLEPGSVVYVRPLEQILATLNQEGMLDGLPFMTEMLGYCGQRCRVASRVEATCVLGSGLRRFGLDDVVTLEGVRCDGQAHEDCQVSCLIFWKEAWLSRQSLPGPGHLSAACEAGTIERLSGSHSRQLLCQSAALRSATQPVGRCRKYVLVVQHLLARRVGFLLIVRYAGPALFWRLVGPIYRFGKGAKAKLARKPRLELADRCASEGAPLPLNPGDWVQVKTKQEIQQTLDGNSRNAGLSFTLDMFPYCGGLYQVRSPIQTIIRETDGKRVHLHNTVSLSQVTCRGLLHCGVCPREHFLWWRHAWLKRVASPG